MERLIKNKNKTIVAKNEMRENPQITVFSKNGGIPFCDLCNSLFILDMKKRTYSNEN